ncbi:paraquat-inducible protein B [Arenibacter aquaticus]|uniref:Paraquat-inducible protein B n=1 Tax=Arenibacter aquaticus TaxID=2489054 RepID=A0A430K5B8_9FLAO|nr:SEC-C metal-binding domain-containing protein [Arenibacter aquaticus]RTE54226.1 paraquat-inducible protein B [Arenibacter aquaticus]
MSIPIVLDKSTFQGLNYEDIIELHKYYIVNVTPLLVSEILGNLAKEEEDDRKLPKDQVTDLAKKMFPYNAYVNMNYKVLVEKSLTGEFTTADNRPFLEAKKSINTPTKKGMTFEETEEELSIKRWKKGEFDTMDEIIADVWRTESKDESVVKTFKTKFDHLKDIKIKGHKASNEEKFLNLKERLRERLYVEIEPIDTLNLVMDYFEINPDLRTTIESRWKNESHPDLKSMADYAMYCYEIVCLYFIGINNSLFGERLTNLLDLEYLFYAPFARVFSTHDKFLRRLFFAVEPKDVFFITLPNLKEDFKKFKALNKDGEVFDEPPVKDSETYRIWDSVFDMRLTRRLKPSADELKRKEAELEEILNIAKTGKEGKFEGEADFVVKEMFMSPDDPCPCKSGKAFKDCHLAETKK